MLPGSRLRFLPGGARLVPVLQRFRLRHGLREFAPMSFAQCQHTAQKTGAENCALPMICRAAY
jgi:hypothetical protein